MDEIRVSTYWSVTYFFFFFVTYFLMSYFIVGYALPPLFDDLGSASFMLICLSKSPSIYEWNSEERLELDI